MDRHSLGSGRHDVALCPDSLPSCDPLRRFGHGGSNRRLRYPGTAVFALLALICMSWRPGRLTS